MKIVGILISICLSVSAWALAQEEEIRSAKSKLNPICPGPGGGWEFGCYQFFTGEKCAEKRYCRWDNEQNKCVPRC